MSCQFLTRQIERDAFYVCRYAKRPTRRFVGSEEEYRVELQELEDEIMEVHGQLVNAQREVEVELPINQKLLETLQLNDTDVVMHYKRNMDDKIICLLIAKG